MIKKFIYELDLRNKKKIIALIEDANPSQGYDDFFKTEERATFVRKDDENATYTNGSYYYIAFNDHNTIKYLDIDILREGVKIRITDNPIYAACYGIEFMHAILDNFDNFGFDNIIEIPSYITLNRKNELIDIFERIFSKIKKDSYCQINEDDEVKFVAQDDDKHYYLTNNFSKAIIMNKKDIRQILVVNGFIDKDIQKSDIYFSPYNCFYDGQSSYAYAGGIDVSFIDDILTVNENTFIRGGLHLVNNEEKSNLLADLSKMFKQQKKSEGYYLSYEGKYVLEKNNEYLLIENPSQATLFSETKIEYIKLAYSLFIKEPKFQRFNTNLVYLYENDNVFSFHNEGKEGIGKIVYSQYYERIKRLILDEFVKGESIIIVDDKYLHLEVLDNNSFALTWLDTGFMATQFSLDAANTLIDIFKWKSMRKDIVSNVDKKRLNISNEKEDTTYEEILQKIIENKDRMCVYDDTYKIKVESEKGSLEYIRRFFRKTISDMEEIFVKLLEDKKINNILVIGSGCNLELLALNNVIEKIGRNINYGTVEMNKWGYFPHIKLKNEIKYKASYRCSFMDLGIDIFKKYDLVIFTKTFNEIGIAPMLEEIKNSEIEIILANIMTSNLYKINDEFYHYFSSFIKVNRKLFDKIVPENNVSTKAFEHMHKKVCRCIKDICSCIEPVTDRKNSYYSVIKLGKQISNYF